MPFGWPNKALPAALELLDLALARPAQLRLASSAFFGHSTHKIKLDGVLAFKTALRGEDLAYDILKGTFKNSVGTIFEC